MPESAPPSLDAAADDIATMRVRGAAALARHAVRGLAEWEASAPDDGFDAAFEKAVKRLLATRPSAVSLLNALRFVQARVSEPPGVDAKRRALADAVDAFVTRSYEARSGIAEHARAFIKDGGTYLTHCNSQAAIAPFVAAREAGVDFEVVALETRPWRQGHLTVRQLADAKVRASLAVDSAAALVMERVDGVITGCDTIAANGDVVNKVGTSTISLLAREAGVPFRVCGESFKVATNVPTGKDVPIEERDVREVVDPEDFPGVTVLNPVFDVTPNERVTAIVTEFGAVKPGEVAEVARKAWGW